eukprot:jgi/Galph1/1648/GphlegSOOS_G330.1
MFEEPEQQELDTVAKFIQCSIVASSKRKNSILKLNTQQIRGVLEEIEIEDRISFTRKDGSGLETVYENLYTKSVWTLATEEEALAVAIRKVSRVKDGQRQSTSVRNPVSIAHKMDNSKNGFALGGIVLIIGLLQEPSLTIRSINLYTLAIWPQNNDVVQTYLIHHNLCHFFQLFFHREWFSLWRSLSYFKVRTRVLLAISTMLDAKEGMESFEQVSGIEDTLFSAICIRRPFNLTNELIILDKSQ